MLWPTRRPPPRLPAWSQSAREHAIALTARGSGTGLSGACIPVAGGAVVSFERMSQILEIDSANHVAVVQPGVSLAQLDAATAQLDLVYPVFPGESSASLGGNVATNAGGMRAVKYGVTRHQVLGLEAVLGTGEIIRTGGRFVKATTGYDLTQLITGSEGTLALVTEASLRLYPASRLPGHGAGAVATLDAVTAAVPPIVASGIGPLMIEYLDQVTMASILAARQLDLGIPDQMRQQALAFLVLVVEQRLDARLDEDVEELAAPGGRPRGARRVRLAASGRGPARSRAASRPSGTPKPPAPTTSSTWWCPGRQCPST